MKNGVIALAISLALGAAAAWGSCAVPHRVGAVLTQSASPHLLASVHPSDLGHVVGPVGGS